MLHRDYPYLTETWPILLIIPAYLNTTEHRCNPRVTIQVLSSGPSRPLAVRKPWGMEVWSRGCATTPYPQGEPSQSVRGPEELLNFLQIFEASLRFSSRVHARVTVEDVLDWAEEKLSRS